MPTFKQLIIYKLKGRKYSRMFIFDTINDRFRNNRDPVIFLFRNTVPPCHFCRLSRLSGAIPVLVLCDLDSLASPSPNTTGWITRLYSSIRPFPIRLRINPAWRWIDRIQYEHAPGRQDPHRYAQDQVCSTSIENLLSFLVKLTKVFQVKIPQKTGLKR